MSKNINTTHCISTRTLRPLRPQHVRLVQHAVRLVVDWILLTTQRWVVGHARHGRRLARALQAGGAIIARGLSVDEQKRLARVAKAWNTYGVLSRRKELSFLVTGMNSLSSIDSRFLDVNNVEGVRLDQTRYSTLTYGASDIRCGQRRTRERRK